MCTHKNLAAAVTLIGRILRILAALDHHCPSQIFRASTHSVCRMAQPSHFFLKAAAASSIPAAQTLRKDDHEVSAGAPAKPMDSPGFHFYRLQRRESAELLLGQILKTHTGIIGDTSTEFNRRKLPCLTWQTF